MEGYGYRTKQYMAVDNYAPFGSILLCLNEENQMNEPEFFEKDGKKIYRQPVECYTRIVGYIRPVQNWNPGKAAEFSDRKLYKVSSKTNKI